MKKVGISLTLLTNIVCTGLGLLGSIFLARELGALGRGELAAIFLWPSLLVYLMSFGLISSATYFSSPNNNASTKVLANLLILCLIQSILVMVLGYFFLDLLLGNQSEKIKHLSKVFLWMVPLGLFTQYLLGILKAYLFFNTFNILRLIIPVGYFLAIVFFWVFGVLNLQNLVYSQILLNFITLVGSFISLVVKRIPIGVAIDLKLLKDMLRYGIKVWIGDLSQSMNLKLDQVLIANMLDLKSLGLYVVALSAVSFSTVVSEAFKVVLAPVVSNEKNRIGKRDQIIYFFKYYWSINIIMHLLLLIIIPIMIPIVFGFQYKEAIIPAEILILASLFINAKNVLAGGFQGLGFPIIPTVAEIAGLVTTVIALVLLLKPLGIIGAAIASLLAYFIQYQYVIYYFNVICKVSYSKIIIPDFQILNILLRKYIPLRKN